MNDLQKRLVEWHITRFPGPTTDFQVFAKAVEELGEVSTILNARTGQVSATGRDGDIGAEIADVVIAMLVLGGRYFDVDVLAEVEKKLAILTAPDSTHRASLRMRDAVDVGPWEAT